MVLFMFVIPTLPKNDVIEIQNNISSNKDSPKSCFWSVYIIFYRPSRFTITEIYRLNFSRILEYESELKFSNKISFFLLICSSSNGVNKFKSKVFLEETIPNFIALGDICT